MGPYLIYKGYIIKDNILIFLGVVSLLYELLWVLNIKTEHCYIIIFKNYYVFLKHIDI